VIKTQQDAENFYEMTQQLNKLYQEIAILSAKKHDATVNQFKIRILNRWIGLASELMPIKYHPIEGFAIFDASEVPTYSDVLVVITQYTGALDRFYSDYTTMAGEEYATKERVWIINDKPSQIEANKVTWMRRK